MELLSRPNQDALSFLAGGGEMGRRIREFDWSESGLGPPHAWPQGLKTAIRIMLLSRQPVWVGWGPDLIYFYNDAYHSIIGGKHPWAFGKPTRVVWSEIWDVIGPMLTTAMGGDEGTYVESQLLIMERNGYPEETYYTFSYSPIPDDLGKPGGIFCANSDDTQRVIGQRELALLKDLASRTAKSNNVDDACDRCATSLATNQKDIPFASIYLRDDSGKVFSRRAIAGIDQSNPLMPENISLEENEFNLLSDLHAETPIDPSNRDVPKGDWPVCPTTLLSIPLDAAGEATRGGTLVVALSPYRRLDDTYLGFLKLVASQIAAAIADADAVERERQRLESLAELDRAKTAFFANVSHEFRTPLTLMLGPLRDVTSGDMGPLPPRVKEELIVAQRNGLRLQKLVNALLDFSRLEAGRMQAIYRPTDVATFTAEIASSFRSAIEKAGLTLQVDTTEFDEKQRVYLDRDLYEKLILNLISNAFKHTFTGGIQVRVRQENEMAVISVTDTGVGIPESELPHIFERFRRVEGSQSRTHEGSGIGLALVQEILRLHGGSIYANSRVEGPDRGTTFTALIPLGKEHLRSGTTSDEEEPERIKSNEAFVNEAVQWLGDQQEDILQGAGAEVRESGARILIAEDNADMRGYLQRLLSKDYIVEVAPDGAAALESIQNQRPDVLLTDVMMPNLDGFGLLKKLRESPQTRDLPVIMLSARAGEEAKIEGLDAGADDYLVKPFSAAELIARVGATITIARVRRQAHEKEIALREAAEIERDRLDIILAGLRDHFIVYDANYRFAYVSDSWLESVGKKREDMLGKSPWDEFPYVKDTEWERAIKHTMETREPTTVQFYSTGYDKWWDLRFWPAQEGGVCQLGLDVTELKASQDALVRSERDLQALNAELERRVAVRTAELEEANGQLNGFTYSVAHDLRQNIRGLVVNGQILLEEQLEKLDRDGRENLERLVASGMKMAELVDNLLRYARLWKEEPYRAQLDFTKIAQTAAAECQARYPEAKIQVQEGLTAYADPSLLKLCLDNLLDNACKYVRPGTAPQVEVGQSGEEFFVRDHGIGFDEKYAKKIFEPFERLDVSGQYPGTGIGLANVHRIVRKHHGNIRAESTSGQGSTFFFTLGSELADRLSTKDLTQGLPAGAT